VKKNTEIFVFSSKEIAIELNAEKTKYMVMFGDQNARQNHHIRIDNKSTEMMEQFK